jgi:hypothetical protein
VDQVEFSEWARSEPTIATVADRKVVEAAEDAVFPPSPAFRVKWGRVLGWSPVLLLAGLGAAVAGRYVWHHPPLFWACAIAASYFVGLIEPAGRR